MNEEKLLNIRKNCKKCNGVGCFNIPDKHFITVKLCECSEKIMLFSKYYKANIPEKYMSLSIKDYLIKIPDRLKKYNKQLDKWFNCGIGLYLHGINGSGKTFLLSEYAKLALAKNLSAYFLSLDNFLKLAYEHDERLDYIKKVDFLAVDEIEKVYKPDKQNSYAEITIDDLFRTRANANKITFITSNCEMDKLHGIHGKHIVSLLREHLIPIELAKVDFRNHIAETIINEVDTESL